MVDLKGLGNSILGNSGYLRQLHVQVINFKLAEQHSFIGKIPSINQQGWFTNMKNTTLLIYAIGLENVELMFFKLTKANAL